jgi:hypothetical protein
VCKRRGRREEEEEWRGLRVQGLGFRKIGCAGFRVNKFVHEREKGFILKRIQEKESKGYKKRNQEKDSDRHLSNIPLYETCILLLIQCILFLILQHSFVFPSPSCPPPPPYFPPSSSISSSSSSS